MLRPKATYNDNRGQHISDSEEFLRARVKVLEAEITLLRKALEAKENQTSAVEFDFEGYIRMQSSGKCMIL